jgi:lipopolysaccharide export system protein LptA
MKHWGAGIVALGLLCAGNAGAQKAASKAAVDEDKLTVITSTRLTFDYKNQYALFEENVVVVDPEMKIFADKMTVRFGADNKVSSIKAEGKVHIMQEDKKARSDTADYDMVSGKIVLRGNPQVTRGRDILTGDTITYWRDDNKMICEPRARLVIYPEGGARDSLMGDPIRGR